MHQSSQCTVRIVTPSLALLVVLSLSLVGCTAPNGDTSQTSASTTPDRNAQGLVAHRSAYSVDSTTARLVRAVESNPNLSVMAEVDHAANASRVNRSLPPTRVVIFGNPNLGTPLMQQQRTVAIDLPQKMLVWEDSTGTVRVAYNAPDHLRARHGISGRDDVLTTISGALETLATGAAGRSPADE